MPRPDRTQETPPRRRRGLAIKAHLQLGDAMSLRVSARATTTELVAIGALVSSILLSVAPIVWAARRWR